MITELVERHRETAGPVELLIDPTLEVSGETVGLVAYRLVQEALANVARHAPGAAARVEVRDSGDGVRVVVEDDGRVTVPAGPVTRGRESSDDDSGFGLIGMGERVALCGGTLLTGPAPQGGFRVEAHLDRRPAP